jgi:Arc/MetJ family transcription regulator
MSMTREQIAQDAHVVAQAQNFLAVIQEPMIERAMRRIVAEHLADIERASQQEQ